MRRRSLTSSIKPSEIALIKLPVKTVMTTAVFLGRSRNKLSRALPTLDPKRSPRVESTPPRISSARIRIQPDTTLGDDGQYRLQVVGNQRGSATRSAV